MIRKKSKRPWLYNVIVIISFTYHTWWFMQQAQKKMGMFGWVWHSIKKKINGGKGDIWVWHSIKEYGGRRKLLLEGRRKEEKEKKGRERDFSECGRYNWSAISDWHIQITVSNRGNKTWEIYLANYTVVTKQHVNQSVRNCVPCPVKWNWDS